MLNSSFCPLPWIHLSSLPDGSARLCCKAVDNRVVGQCGEKMNLGKDSINSIWNSDYYKKIRQAMLNDTQPVDCEVCYNEDRNGKRSMRVKELEIWKDSEKLNTAIENTKDGEVLNVPSYLDLRMGNLCNLKCRTCDPVSSSQIFKEGLTVEEQPEFFSKKMYVASTMDDWWKTDVFKDSLKLMIPTTELVWLSGGEPTLVPEGNELIQNLIDTGKAKDIKLRYVINLTNLTDKFISQIEKFKSVDFHCSIDGIEEVNHYMRYPSDFKTLEQNLEKLTNTNANLICLIHTVSNLNIYRVPDVIDWIEKFNIGKRNKVKLNINVVNKPELFHISLLDRSTKELVSSRLLSYKTNQKNTTELKSLCDMMNEEKHNKNKLQKDFYNYVTTIDKSRNQDILKYLPELENFLMECKNG